MIAVLRLELWLTFWVALALGMAFGLPVLEMNEHGVVGLLNDDATAKALARLAIALPFGLALFQFGLQRMRGTLAVLLHRGIEARDAFRAKFVLAMVFSSLVFAGVVMLEYRISVGQNGNDPLFARVLAVIPQMTLLGAVGWALGANVVLGGGRSMAALGLRGLVGALMAVGVHHWAGAFAEQVDSPLGYSLYAVLVIAAAVLLFRRAGVQFGDDGPRTPVTQGRIALQAALAAALLFPWFSGVGQQVARYAQLRLQPRAPRIVESQDGELLLWKSVPGERSMERLNGEVVVADQRSLPDGFQLVPVRHDQLRRTGKTRPERVEPAAVRSEFPPVISSWMPRSPAAFTATGESGGDVEWTRFISAPAVGVSALVNAGSGVLTLTAQQFEPNGQTTFLQRTARRTDGGSIGKQCLFLTPRRFGTERSKEARGSLFVDESDGTYWRVDAARGADALQPVSGPPGERFMGWQRFTTLSTWKQTGLLSDSGWVAETSSGKYLWNGTDWDRFEGAEGIALASELDPKDIGPRLMIDSDPLGDHRAQLLAAGGAPVHEFDLTARGSRARSSRIAFVAAEVLRPPVSRAVGLASHPYVRAWSAQLPVWLFALHLVVGLLCGGFGWRRAKPGRGRWLFAAVGFLGGPLAAGALHICRAGLDDAEAAGPAGAPTDGLLPRGPIFADELAGARPQTGEAPGASTPQAA